MKNLKLTKRLPRRMSLLLRAAVHDAQAVEKDPRYRLQMSSWYEPAGPVCEVCMAGATIARRSNATRRHDVIPSDFPKLVEDKLEAINCMRRGDFSGSAIYLGLFGKKYDLDVMDRADAIVRCYFSYDIGRASWAAYLRAADVLEEAGL